MTKSQFHCNLEAFVCKIFTAGWVNI